MRIELAKLIKQRNLDKAVLAKVLFPGNLHPAQALTRLLAGRNTLKETQIFRLSAYTGLSMEALYDSSLQWGSLSNQGTIRFNRDNYVAIYSAETGITKVFHLEKLISTHVLSQPNQPLSQYLSEINQIIINKSVKS
jgi:hypothetical protein